MDSKQCSKCGEEKPVAEFYKAKNKKDGLRGECKSCSKSVNKSYYKSNAEQIKERTTQYRLDNKEARRDKDRATKQKWCEENEDRVAQYRKKHNGSEKHKAACSRWCKNNRAKGRAYLAKYRAAKLQQTPSWASEQLIAAYYAEAKRLEELTGIKFHVDHIIPLQGELVSGLHVESNLQLLMAHENLGKSNKFDPVEFCA